MSAKPWIKEFVDRIERSVELGSPGSLDIRFNEVECQLVIAPNLVELIGGQDDGDEVFPFFTVHLSVLMDAFDETPEVMWQTMHDELWIEGTIRGEEAFVIIRRNPFKDAGPATQVLDGNMLRDKLDQPE